MKQCKRVLILGATGHIGQAIVRHWLNRGCRVTAATRQTHPAALDRLPVEKARVSEGLDEIAALAAAHDLVVDSGAPHPTGAFGFGHPFAIDAAVQRTARVIEAALAAGVPLAFVSSFTTLPRSEPPAQAAAAAWRRSVYPYFAAKVEMERHVLEAARRGLPAVIVNPSACLGPWEFRAENSSLVRLVLASRLPVVMHQSINVIDVREVAHAIDLALRHECFARPIPLAGHNTTVADLVARIAALGGAAGEPVCVDPRVASAAALWMEASFGALGRTPPDLWRAVPLIADSLFMTPSLEQISIGLPLRPLEETLRDAVAFHRIAPRR